MLKKIKAHLSVFAKNWVPVLAGSALMIGFFAFLFSAYLTAIDRTAGGLLTPEWADFWASFGAVAGILLIIIKPLWDAAKGDGHLKNKIVAGASDMEQMAKYMKSADKVVIYSGDFSYIYDYEPLRIILDNLSSREQLTLLSYKSQETVERMSTGAKGAHECIIQRLIASDKIFFDVPERPKFSLVYRKGEEVLLYKHRSNGSDYVTIFKASNEMARELVNILNMLVDGIVRRSGA